MNDKEEEIKRIVEIVVGCCVMTDNDSITSALVLGGSKRENVVMTRCVLVAQLVRAGYTVTTCAELLGCSPQAVRLLLSRGYDLERSSRAYRLASAEASRLIDEGVK